MSNDFESRIKNAAEKVKPVIDTLLADLEREANLIKERDLDPRKFAEEPKVKEARSAAVDALENLTAFAKSLDALAKQYASDAEKKVDVDNIKEHLAAAPAAARAKIDESHSHGMGERIRTTGEETLDRLESSAHEQRERVDEAAHKGKERISSAAHQGKDDTSEMLAALGWATAAGAVVYIVFMDEKRRKQAKSVCKTACDGLRMVVHTASNRS